MNSTVRPLQKTNAPTAAEAAKRFIGLKETSPERMARSADTNVIALLNLKPNRVTKRVTWIVERFQEVIQVTERITHYCAQGSASDIELKEERYKILIDLNAHLSKYEWNPVVRNSVSEYSYFHVRFEAGPNPVLIEPRKYSERIDFNTPSGAAFFENRAVQWIVENISIVHRIRRCHYLPCHKWFFAVTDHQKYCGDTCRKKDASQGKSFKEKRAAYMKEYRNKEAEMDARSKQLAKGKGK
jgi:hypothetical protein